MSDPGLRWADHNFLLTCLEAAGQREAIRAIHDLWDEIDRLWVEIFRLQRILHS